MTDSNALNRRHFLAAAALAGGAAVTAGGATPAAAAAPMGGADAANVRRVKLGGFEVLTVNDGAAVREDVHSIFGTDQPMEDVAALMERNLLPMDKLAIPFTPTAVNTGGQVVLFDTGIGAGGRPGVGNTRARLAAAGIAPEAVDVVVITHMHPDHIGGLMEDGAPAYPNAEYVTAATEYDFWKDKAEGPMARVGKLVAANVTPLAERMRFIKAGDSVASGIDAVAAAGHTPGHTAYHIESEGKRLVITADAANHYVASLERPDWHVRFDMDKEGAAKTRRDLFGMIAADRIPFIGYHMPQPAIGFVVARGEGFHYVPATYQIDL